MKHSPNQIQLGQASAPLVGALVTSTPTMMRELSVATWTVRTKAAISQLRASGSVVLTRVVSAIFEFFTSAKVECWLRANTALAIECRICRAAFSWLLDGSSMLVKQSKPSTMLSHAVGVSFLRNELLPAKLVVIRGLKCNQTHHIAGLNRQCLAMIHSERC